MQPWKPPLKVAQVGLGYWGIKLLRNLVEICGAESVVAVDANPAAVKNAARVYPHLGYAADLDTALADPQVGAVVIATPVETHADLARQVLRAGRHVMVEKPLSQSVREGAELVELAAQHDVQLMVGHTFLFSPRVERIHDDIRAGRIGAIHYVTSSRLNLGQHRSDANVIWDLAPHDFSIVCFLLDEFPLTAQTAARGVVRDDLPEVAFINLTFPSGVLASVAVSWLAPRKVRSTVVVGETRMVVYDDTNPDEPIRFFDKGLELPDSASFGEHQLTYRYGDTVAPHVSAQEPLQRELVHFLECVRTGSPCRSDGVFGMHVVEALEAADRSWREGGRIVEVRPSITTG